jgi:hypothetical protein
MTFGQPIRVSKEMIMSFVRLYNLTMFVRSADKNRDSLVPDILATAPDLEDNGLYDFFGRYVQRVHSNDFIWKALMRLPQTSFLDIIGPSDIVYVISIIKNSGEVWDQDVKMK